MVWKAKLAWFEKSNLESHVKEPNNYLISFLPNRYKYEFKDYDGSKSRPSLTNINERLCHKYIVIAAVLPWLTSSNGPKASHPQAWLPDKKSNQTFVGQPINVLAPWHWDKFIIEHIVLVEPKNQPHSWPLVSSIMDRLATKTTWSPGTSESRAEWPTRQCC